VPRGGHAVVPRPRASAATTGLYGEFPPVAAATVVGAAAFTLGRTPAVAAVGLGLGRHQGFRAVDTGEEHNRKGDRQHSIDNHSHFENASIIE